MIMIKKSKNVKTTIDSDGELTGFYFEKDKFSVNIYDKQKQQKSKKERNRKTAIDKAVKTRVELRLTSRQFKQNEKYLLGCLVEICELLVQTTNRRFFENFINSKVRIIWEDYAKYVKIGKNGLVGDYGDRMYYLGKYNSIISCGEIAAKFLTNCGLKDVDSEMCKLRKHSQIPEEKYTDYKRYIKHIVEGYLGYFRKEIKKNWIVNRYFKRIKKGCKTTRHKT